MATPRLAKRLSELQHSSKARRLRRRERESRRLQLESLEDRRLMAVGPSLVAVLSNNGDFLDAGDTLNIAPRDLTFRFSQGASIDPSSISSGIQLLRSGGDKVVAVQIRRFPPFLNLRPLQSTAITWMVLGTKDPVRLRLRNTAPDLATNTL